MTKLMRGSFCSGGRLQQRYARIGSADVYARGDDV